MMKPESEIKLPNLLPDSEEESKKKNRRLLAIIILAVLFLAAVGFLLHSLRSDSGWREVTAKGGAEPDAGGSFRFWYQIQSSAGGNDYNTVRDIYTESLRRLYKIFDVFETHEGINGIRALNDASGTAIKLEPELYRALSQLEEDGGRYLYLAPIYSVYNELFFANDEVLARSFDPYYDKETADYFATLMPFLSDDSHIRIELLGEDRACLHISEAYKRFAEENGISIFLDFFWMKNAFMIDALADRIKESGYTHGYLVSNEGWVRCLDDSDEIYELSVTDLQERTIYYRAKMRYKGPVQLVSFYDYTDRETYSDYYFAYSDGGFATAYIDPADGYYKSAYHDLILYSREASCADLLLEGMKMILTKSPDSRRPAELAAQGIWPVFYQDEELIHYGDAEFILAQ